MADVVGRQVQQQPNMRVGEPVVDPAAIASSAHHVGGAQQPHCLTHHVLRHTGDTGQVAHAQLPGLQQRVQDRQSSRIPQQPEQLRRLDVRLAPRHPVTKLLQRSCWLVAMRRTHIQINDRALANSSHTRHYICAAEQMTRQSLEGNDVDIAALALYLLWASLAFGWRTIDQWRRTGDSGLRLRAEPNTPQWWAKIGFGIAILVGFAAPVAAVAGLGNIAALDAAWLHIAGIIVTVAGIALTVAAQYSMGASWRIGVDPHERTDLVTDGAFRLARNPIFTAMLITAAGLALMIPNIISLIGLVSLVAALEIQVRLVEEPHLVHIHGDRYRAYAQRVGRFTPGIGHIDEN